LQSYAFEESQGLNIGDWQLK